MASIQKRPNGKYLVRWRNEENKERSKQFDLMRDAKRYAAEVETQLARGTYVDPRAGNITLQNYFDDWKRRQIWTGGTERAMRLSVYSATFADTPLNKIRKSHIESWVKQMEVSLAPNTIHSRFQNVKTVLRAAVDDDLILKDPSQGVRLPRRHNRASDMRIPTAAEIKQLYESSEDWFAAFVALCAFAGLRRGEAAAIKLSDIDFLGRSIHVQRQIQKEAKKDPEIRAPKYNSDRTVFIPDELVVILSEHVKKFGVYGMEQWLFPGLEGWPINPRQASYRWERAISGSDIKDITLHDLRHFFASGLIASGCDVVTVQRAMGHKSPSVTLDTYSHMWPDAADRTRAAVGGLMRDVFSSHEDQVRTKNSPNQV